MGDTESRTVKNENHVNNHNKYVSIFLQFVGIFGIFISFFIGIKLLIYGREEAILLTFGIGIPILLLVLAAGVIIDQLDEISRNCLKGAHHEEM